MLNQAIETGIKLILTGLGLTTLYFCYILRLTVIEQIINHLTF